MEEILGNICEAIDFEFMVSKVIELGIYNIRQSLYVCNVSTYSFFGGGKPLTTKEK